MLGHKGSGPLYDEYRREPMDWYTSASGTGETHWFQPLKYTQPNDGISVEEETKDPNSLLNYYRRVFALRAANPALAQGAYQTWRADPPQGIVAFWRYTGQQIVSVIFNMGAKATTTSLKLDGAPGTLAQTPVDLLTGQPINIDPKAVSLPPGGTLVLDWTAR
jgi:alpha-amylase